MNGLIADTAERIFSDHVDRGVLDAAEGGEFPDALWNVIREAGLHLVGSPGSGTDDGDLFGLLKIAGRHAVPLPLAEVLVANSSLDEAGLTTIAVDGVAPWGRAADRVLTVEGEISGAFDVTEGANLAGESPGSDQVARPPSSGSSRAVLRTHGAVPVPRSWRARSTGFLRWPSTTPPNASSSAGPSPSSKRFSTTWRSWRGRWPRRVAPAMARSCPAASPNFAVTVGAAKARVGEAAGIAAEIAHQVHGAMGFTHEHSLHHFTRRLWAWRDEYGRETRWQEELGRRVADGGADSVWEFLVGVG